MIGQSHDLGSLLPSSLVVPRAGLRFLENRKITCLFLCSCDAVRSGHPDVVSDKGEGCLSCFLYWRSSHSTSAPVVVVFVTNIFTLAYRSKNLKI